MSRNSIVLYKKSIVIILLIMVTLLLFSIPKITAEENHELKIEYDGDTKIISNIENYFNDNQKARIATTYASKEEKYLKTIGFTEQNIESMDQSQKKDIINAKKVYVLQQDYDKDGNIMTTASGDVEGPLYKENNWLTMQFLVLDEGTLYKGQRTFSLITKVDWKLSHPTWRYTDCIATAWSNTAIHAGTLQATYSMTYIETMYLNGIESYSRRINDTENIDLANNFPKDAVTYKLPRNQVLPQIRYTQISLSSQVRVTATETFLAMANYGHKTIVGTAKPTFSTNSGFDLTIMFEGGTDEYMPGIIRVDV